MGGRGDAKDRSIAPNEVRLAEYAALRAEIAQRSSFQQALIALNLTAVAGIVGFVLDKGASKTLILLVPVISATLGLLWLDHHRHIRLLRLYICELWTWEPSWEAWRKSSDPSDRAGAEIVYYLAVGIVYGGASIAALASRWSHVGGDAAVTRDVGASLTLLFLVSYASLARLETKPETSVGWSTRA